MIINSKVKRDRYGNIKSPVSAYSPDSNVKEVTAMVMSDFALADTVKNRPYKEFNNKTLLDRQSLDQSRFNAFQDDVSDDPDESWKSNAVRPLARNRAISITAHITANLIYPMVFAQNDRDEEDVASATVMRDLMEIAAEESEYEKKFLYSVIAALVNPAVIIHTEYAEVYRTIKKMSEDGKTYTKKEVLDEVYSGFQDSIVPLNEIWFPDFYQNNIQKQIFVIRRRVLMFEVARAKYGDHPNWKYIKPGIQNVFVGDSAEFYEASDDNLSGNQVEEVVYWNHQLDCQLVFVNGVMMCDPDYPNPREDKLYPFAMTGYEPIDEGQFAFYKSLIFKLGPDEEVLQTLYRMVIDGTYLQLMPPMAVYGDEEITSNIAVPGTMVNLSKDSKIAPIGFGASVNMGMNTLEKIESSMNESSVDPAQSGIGGATGKTAFEIGKNEQNAKIMLGLFNRMISFLVKDWGKLRISDILQYTTLGEVLESTDEATSMKFKNFLIPNKTVNGKSKTRRIRFNHMLPTDPAISEEVKTQKEFKLLSEAGDDTEIIEVNPDLFRRRKFLLKVSPDIVTPPSDNLKRALNLEAYDRAVANPLTNQEAVLRDLLFGSYDMTKGDSDKYINKQSAQPQQSELGGLVGAEGQQAKGNSAVAMLTNQRAQESAVNVIKGGG